MARERRGPTKLGSAQSFDEYAFTRKPIGFLIRFGTTFENRRSFGVYRGMNISSAGYGRSGTGVTDEQENQLLNRSCDAPFLIRCSTKHRC